MSEYQKKYKLSERGKITQSRYYHSQAKRDSNKRWRLKNAEKMKAHHIVERAIKNGILVRKKCEKCDEKGFAHHDDYSKPLDVRWLCNYHHCELHRLLLSAKNMV